MYSRQCRQAEIGESAEPETNESILTDTEPVVENEVADEEHNYMQSYSSLVLEIKVIKIKSEGIFFFMYLTIYIYIN